MTQTEFNSIFEADYYSRGLAVAESRILTDTIYARFRNEEFEGPSREIHFLISYELPFPSVPVKKLRDLKSKSLSKSLKESH